MPLLLLPPMLLKGAAGPEPWHQNEQQLGRAARLVGVIWQL